MTIIGDDCPMRCAVSPTMVEFRFGDHNSGLHLHMDATALGTLLGLVTVMISRIKTLKPDQPAEFIIDGNEIDDSRPRDLNPDTQPR